MRILLLFVITLFLQKTASAQPGDGGRYPVADTKPHFNGDLNAYLVSNLRLPEENRQTGGRVLVEFLIDTMGNVSNVYVMRRDANTPLSPLEKEVMRVVKMMPPWIPGKLKGHKVAVKYSLPVNIR